MDEIMLKSALFYHNEGLTVIPCVQRDKNPAIAWKEYQTRCSTEEEVKKWFGNGNGYNIGIVHREMRQGDGSSFICLDLDHDKGLFDGLRQIFPALFVGRVEQSGSGEGYHIPLRLDTLPDFGNDGDGKPRGNKTWKLTTGALNLRIRNCQTVVPPSVHPSGRRYKFIQKGNIARLASLDDLITWLDSQLPKPKQQQKPNKAITPPTGDSLIDAVKAAFPDAIAVFQHWGKVHKLEETRDGLKLRGNTGLYVKPDNHEVWYCFGDEVGGGVFEAWGWCMFGQQYDNRRQFRDVLLDMATAAGIDAAAFYRRGDEGKVEPPAPTVDRGYWGKRYQGFWERAR
jgi:hypothetical protein